MKLKQFVLIGLSTLAACSSDPPPAAPIAGTGVAAGTTAAGGGGIGMTPSPVGAAGMTAGAGTVGFAGQAATAGQPAAAGTGVAGTGAAGMIAATAGTGMSAAGTGAAGASAAGAGAAGMAAPAFTPGSPTFSAIYQEIFVGTGCNGGPTCHSNTVAGGLKLTNKDESYAALVNVKAAGTNIPPGGKNCVDTGLMRVLPGDPAKSLLLKKVEPMPECGERMPIGGMIMPAQIEQIRMWIMNGAKND